MIRCLAIELQLVEGTSEFKCLNVHPLHALMSMQAIYTPHSRQLDPQGQANHLQL